MLFGSGNRVGNWSLAQLPATTPQSRVTVTSRECSSANVHGKPMLWNTQDYVQRVCPQHLCIHTYCYILLITLNYCYILLHTLTYTSSECAVWMLAGAVCWCWHVTSQWSQCSVAQSLHLQDASLATREVHLVPNMERPNAIISALETGCRLLDEKLWRIWRCIVLCRIRFRRLCYNTWNRMQRFDSIL